MISKGKHLNKLLDWLWSHIPVICWSKIHCYVSLWSQINFFLSPLCSPLLSPLIEAYNFNLNSHRVIHWRAYSAVKHSIPVRDGGDFVCLPLNILCAPCGLPSQVKIHFPPGKRYIFTRLLVMDTALLMTLKNWIQFGKCFLSHALFLNRQSSCGGCFTNRCVC